MSSTPITAQISVNADINTVWKLWTTPAHIMQWNMPGADWHTPHVENDVRTGGTFVYRMAMKNGSFAFDFTGTYNKVVEHRLLDYTLTDGRHVVNTFTQNGNSVTITETFDPESETPAEQQKDFCMAVLGNFKRYAEQAM